LEGGSKFPLQGEEVMAYKIRLERKYPLMLWTLDHGFGDAVDEKGLPGFFLIIPG
jgi:hypothetical protein